MTRDLLNVELLDVHGTDKTIAESAWCSSGRGDINDDSRIERLIKKLSTEGHETPFEHVTTRWRITAPQRIQVQLLRHRLASHNVASARYGHRFEKVYGIKQTILDEKLLDDVFPQLPLFEEIIDDLQHATEYCLDLYNLILDHPYLADKPTMKRRLREIVAFGLPQGTISHQILSINLRSLKNLFTLRCSEHAQLEIQVIANTMVSLLHDHDDLKHTLQYFFNKQE